MQITLALNSNGTLKDDGSKNYRIIEANAHLGINRINPEGGVSLAMGARAIHAMTVEIHKDAEDVLRVKGFDKNGQQIALLNGHVDDDVLSILNEGSPSTKKLAPLTQEEIAASEPRPTEKKPDKTDTYITDLQSRVQNGEPEEPTDPGTETLKRLRSTL